MIFRGFFNLSKDFLDIRYRDEFEKMIGVTFFYSGLIIPDPKNQPGKYLGKMFGRNESDILIYRLTSEELHFGWSHPVLKDFVDFSLFRNDELHMIGDFRGEKVGRSITLCLLPKRDLMKILAESLSNSTAK